jgi:uncharacterized membrane protein YjjP (DUF1212 family)
MVDITHVVEDILNGSLNPQDGLGLIHDVVARSPHWPSWYTVPCVSLLCCSGCVAFGGGSNEMLTSAFTGFVIGSLMFMAPGHITLSRGLDLLSGVLSSMVAVLVNAYIHPIYLMPAIFGGIFWCLPGLRATLAMNDMSMGNTVTGTGKLMSAIITVIQLAVGVTAGLDLNKAVGGTLVFTPDSQLLPNEFVYTSILIDAFPTMILMDAKPTHFIQLCAGYLASFALANNASVHIGSQAGVWLAAFVCGAVGNIYGRVTINPAIEYWLFSIIMLVPGAIGVQSVLSGNSNDALSLFTQMIGVAVAIVTGLFTANFAVPPKRAI